jgi:hypothetical protein
MNFEAIKAYICTQVACGALTDPQKRLRPPGPLSPGHRVCDKHMPPADPAPAGCPAAEENAPLPPKKRPLDGETWSFHAKLDRDAVQAQVSCLFAACFWEWWCGGITFPHGLQINEWSSVTGYHTRVIFTPASMDLPEAAKRQRTITLFSRAPAEPTDLSPALGDERSVKGRKNTRPSSRNRVWHNGHKDLLVGDEMFHVGTDGAVVPHGNVWNLDDLLGLYGEDAVTAELTGLHGGFSGVKSPERLEAPCRSSSSPDVRMGPVPSSVPLRKPSATAAGGAAGHGTGVVKTDDFPFDTLASQVAQVASCGPLEACTATITADSTFAPES